MVVPQGRNEKKHKGRGRAGRAVARRRFSLDNGYSSNQQEPGYDYGYAGLLEPGDMEQEPWSLDNPGPDFEERLMMMVDQRDSLFVRPPSFLDRDTDNDPDPDIGNDFDDLFYDESDTW